MPPPSPPSPMFWSVAILIKIAARTRAEKKADWVAMATKPNRITSGRRDGTWGGHVMYADEEVTIPGFLILSLQEQ